MYFQFYFPGFRRGGGFRRRSVCEIVLSSRGTLPCKDNHFFRKVVGAGPVYFSEARFSCGDAEKRRYGFRVPRKIRTFEESKLSENRWI